MVTEGTVPADGTTASTTMPPGSATMPPGQSGGSAGGLPSVTVPGSGLSLAVAGPARVGPPARSADDEATAGTTGTTTGTTTATDATAASVVTPGPAGPGAEETPRHQLADRAAALFRRWRDGDAVASAELVGLLTPTLWHTARAYRLDGAAAEDVVQNAWLALARRRDQLRDPQAVLAWLLVTVRRDAARTAAAARSVVPDPEPVLAVSPDTAPGPAATVIDDDMARRLWDAVGRLSERCQRLLRVVAFSDRPDYASLSTDLGMPVGSIGPTRGRCLKKLREHLGQEQGWTA